MATHLPRDPAEYSALCNDMFLYHSDAAALVGAFQVFACGMFHAASWYSNREAFEEAFAILWDGLNARVGAFHETDHYRDVCRAIGAEPEMLEAPEVDDAVSD